MDVGTAVGSLEGGTVSPETVGALEGAGVGCAEGMVGVLVGEGVGDFVGLRVGDKSSVGDSVEGTAVGG